MEKFTTPEQLPLAETAVAEEQEKLGSTVARINKKSALVLAGIMSLMTSVGCASNGEKIDFNHSWENARDALLSQMHQASVDARASANFNHPQNEFNNSTDIHIGGNVGYPKYNNGIRIESDTNNNSSGPDFDLHKKH